MSYTEIHFLHKDSNKSFQVGEIKNAWRGAMYVWDYIAKKYFDLPSFPSFDRETQMKVWNAGKYTTASEHDLFVLATTMDNATIDVKDKQYAIEMMRKFQEENPNSSIGEQADLIDGCESSEGKFAFCQTSITVFWGLFFDEDLEEYAYIELDGNTEYFCAVKHAKSYVESNNESTNQDN